jgi:hypothetical protein
MDFVDKLCRFLGLDNFDNQKNIEAFPGKIGIKNSHLIFLFSVIFLHGVVLEIGSGFLVDMFGLVYPTYRSLSLLIY